MEMNNDNIIVQMWIGIGIPFRPCGGTYGVYDLTKWPLPTIAIEPFFENINTLHDIKHNEKALNKYIYSATSCYVKCGKNEEFYFDQQGCVIWHYNPFIGVYTMDIHKDEKTIVAKTISEFFSRIHMENCIWSKVMYAEICNDSNILQFCRESVNTMFSASAEWMNHIEDIWILLKTILTQNQIVYMMPFYDMAKEIKKKVDKM